MRDDIYGHTVAIPDKITLHVYRNSAIRRALRFGKMFLNHLANMMETLFMLVISYLEMHYKSKYEINQ